MPVLWFSYRRAATLEGFDRLIEVDAARIGQKATLDYCRARAGLNWWRLIDDVRFKEALETAQWGGLAAVWADLLVLAEGSLRPHAAGRAERLSAGLVELYARGLGRQRPPAHAGLQPDADVAALRQRLGQAQLAAPKAPVQVGEVGGTRIFDLLPLHESLRQLDRETVVASVAFSLIGFQDRLARRVDLPRVAAALTA